MKPDLATRLLAGVEAERGRSSPPADFPELPPIPAGRYTEDAFRALEAARLWRRSWLYACHLDQLPRTGSFLRWERTGSPLVIVRSAPDRVRAFHNVCRHRGGPLVQDASGTLDGRFICAFHGWTYDLDGRLRGVRDAEDFVGLDMACLGLEAAACERLGDWVFINEDRDAPPLEAVLEPVAGQLRYWGVMHTRHVDTREFPVACNFKFMLENFFEVYHLGTVHRGTVNRFLDYRGAHIRLWPRGHSLMFTPHRDPDWVDPGTRGLPEFDAAPALLGSHNVSYHLFPNLVTPVAGSGLPFLQCWPTGPHSSVIQAHWFAPAAGQAHPARWRERLDNFARILEEDMAIAAHQQRSAASPAFGGTRVGYQERRIYHWHEALDRRLGPERIPRGLAVAPRLGGNAESLANEHEVTP